nr:uncharacterized protein LOC128703584 isoform X4 [Cherax quadricarinatus]
MSFMWRGAWGGVVCGSGNAQTEDKRPPQHNSLFPWKTWGNTSSPSVETYRLESASGSGGSIAGVPNGIAIPGSEPRSEDATKRSGSYFGGYFRAYLGKGDVEEDSGDGNEDNEVVSVASSGSDRLISGGDGVKRVVIKGQGQEPASEEPGPRASYFTFPWRTGDDNGPSAYLWKKRKVTIDRESVPQFEEVPPEEVTEVSRSGSKVVPIIRFPWRQSSEDAGGSPGTEEPSFSLPWGAADKSRQKGEVHANGNYPTEASLKKDDSSAPGNNYLSFPWRRRPTKNDLSTEAWISTLSISWLRGNGVKSDSEKERKNDVVGQGGGASPGTDGEQSKIKDGDTNNVLVVSRAGGERERESYVVGQGGGASPGADGEQSKIKDGDSNDDVLGKENIAEVEKSGGDVNIRVQNGGNDNDMVERSSDGGSSGVQKHGGGSYGVENVGGGGRAEKGNGGGDISEIEEDGGSTEVEEDGSHGDSSETEKCGAGGGSHGSGNGGGGMTTSTQASSTPYLQHLAVFTSRAAHFKTKILQNLGKADRTVDDVFDDYEINFSRQQNNASRLHKEVANYLRCCRALHGASKSLFETLAEVYEPEWVGHELLYAQAQNSDMLWTDFCHKVQDQTLAPLTAYHQQFPEVRKKIDKRGRKLVDYDSQRHQLENLQRANRRDEYKIARARDALETARVTYEVLNKELYEELPALYDQRIPNVSASLQTLFAAEATVMAESSKVAKELEAIADKLSKECAKGTYKVKRGVAPRPLSVVESSPKTINSPSMWYDGGAVEEGGNSFRSLEGNEGTLDITTTEDNQESSPTLEHKETYKSIPDSDQRTPTPPPSPLPLESPSNDADSVPSAPIDSEHDTNNRPTISGPVTTNKEETGRPYEEIEFEDKKVNGTVSPQARTNGEVIGTKIPPGATTEGLPQGVLYRVRATYKYTREDVDEISFEVGDTIQVVEYEDPEEQEEGWLTGIKEGTMEKGLFPANFTRPI